MDRIQQLQQLETSLNQLVEILHFDPNCQWSLHFDSCLQQTRQLLHKNFTQDQLNELSSSIMYVYGGMGSFNDYAPTKYNPNSKKCSVILGTERFEEIAVQVYDQALGLRVVGNAL